MPLLDYSAIADFPFQPLTIIYSSDINSMFNTIKTLLNTTKLDDTNVQVHGLTRLGATSRLKAGTANAIMVNDTNGDMSEVVGLSGQVLQIDNTGAPIMGPVPAPASATLLNYYNFT